MPGHSALTTRADWREHMKIGHDEAGFNYVRYHAVLDDSSMYFNAPSNKYASLSTYWSILCNLHQRVGSIIQENAHSVYTTAMQFLGFQCRNQHDGYYADMLFLFKKKTKTPALVSNPLTLTSSALTPT